MSLAQMRRRAFLATGLIGALSGCLRAAQSQNTSTTAQGTATKTKTEDTTVTISDEPKDTTSATSEEKFPHLKLHLVKQMENSGNSSPVSAIATLGEDYFATTGSGEVAVYSYSSLKKRQSVAIPDVNNFGTHGLTNFNGDVYSIVGGKSPLEVKRISPKNGEIWSFQSDHFATDIRRTVPDPVVTDQYVIFATGVVRNEAGENDSVWYILDRNTGDKVAKPAMDVFQDENCASNEIAETNGLILVQGCGEGKIYDLKNMSYSGSVSESLSDGMEGNDGIVYTGNKAVKVSEQSTAWTNQTGGARGGIVVAADYIYFYHRDNVYKVRKKDGLIVWTVNTSPYSPSYLTVDDGGVWLATTSTGSVPGQILRIESGSVTGAYPFNPMNMPSSSSIPYDLIKHGNHIYTGTNRSIVKLAIV